MLRQLRVVAFGFLVLVGASRSPAGDMHAVDLSKHFNERLDGGYGRSGQGNNLARLPRGERKYGDVTFTVGDGLMQLGSLRAEKFPERIDGIAVSRKCAKVHVLHATLYGGSGKAPNPTQVIVDEDQQIGEYIIKYIDDSTEGFPIIHGRDVRDWWFVPGDSDAPTVGKVAWEGTNEFADGKRAGIRVYSGVWENPHRDKVIKSIDFVGRKEETAAAPFCLAITLEDVDVKKPKSPPTSTDGASQSPESRTPQ